MNFLDLCKRLRQEAGGSGTGPASVTDQTGFDKQIVDWIATSYEFIQNLHPTWLFLRKDFEFDTTIGKREYSIADTGITDLRNWKIDQYGDIRYYLKSSGVNAEQYMQFLIWDDYKQIYLFGSTRNASGQPQFCSIHPDKSLDFYLVPDAVYTINGEYWRTPDVMTANTSIPIFPDEFHMIIVWYALTLYGAFDSAEEKYSQGRNEYRKMKLALEFDQLPVVSYGKPLA